MVECSLQSAEEMQVTLVPPAVLRGQHGRLKRGTRDSRDSEIYDRIIVVDLYRGIKPAAGTMHDEPFCCRSVMANVLVTWMSWTHWSIVCRACRNTPAWLADTIEVCKNIGLELGKCRSAVVSLVELGCPKKETMRWFSFGSGQEPILLW